MKFNTTKFTAAIAIGFTLVACKKEEVMAPAEEIEIEVITDVKLIFTNVNDSTDVVEAAAQDPDGTGVQPLSIQGPITLGVDKTYALTYQILNSLSSTDSDIGAEILEEATEHQLFYSFSEDAFNSPIGNGNIDNASDVVNYSDSDSNGNPIGLATSWTTSSNTLAGGTFTTRLQHQPDGLKTASSGANDGDTDFELQFVLNIQ